MRLPWFARLVLHGQYPHARYMSVSSYRANDSLVDELHDAGIRPDPGSTNPFQAGALRNVGDRGYTLSIVGRPRPSAARRQPNTLYAGFPLGEQPRLRQP